MTQFDLLSIVSAFRAAISTIDPLGSAFEERRAAAIGDTTVRRVLTIGSVRWIDTVTLICEPIGIDAYRLRLSWQVSIQHADNSLSSMLSMIAISDSGATEIEISAALARLRNEIDHRHIMFAKALLDSVSGHEPVVAK